MPGGSTPKWDEHFQGPVTALHIQERDGGGRGRAPWCGSRERMSLQSPQGLGPRQRLGPLPQGQWKHCKV